MRRLAHILQTLAIILILGVALCADGIMEAYGLVGFLIRAGACIAVAGVLGFVGNRLERREKENRPQYRNYRGRRGKRYR